MRRMIFCAVTGLVLILAADNSFAQLELGSPFGNNMVLQHDQPTKIWGWAAPGEEVTVQIQQNTGTATAAADGKWDLELAAPGLGEAFTISAKANSGAIELSNVVAGEVWICSGQSNMEWPVKKSNNADDEIAAANFPMIRHMKVDRVTSMAPKEKAANTGWKVCTPETVGDFTAVGYFFARKLHEDLQVPIGLVNTSWGGTIIETWISGNKLRQHPDFKETVEAMQAEAVDPKATAELAKQVDEWNSAYKKMLRLPSEENEGAGFDDSAWGMQKVPGAWEQQGFADVDGVAWYRRKVAIPAAWKKSALQLSLATIDDADRTYVNGVLVGQNDQWNAKRNYTVPADIVESEELTIAVKVSDGGMGGGIVGDADEMFLALAESDGQEEKIELDGQWKFRLESATEKLGPRPQGRGSDQNQPMMLYNAMVNPLVPFAVKGAIWYQGESNGQRGRQYRALFPMLINNWREAWGNEMSFYWVQLANFEKAIEQPWFSGWAELREAQTMTLALPKTGQAVIIDIGEAGDIHPRNKQDVGDRLARIALAKDYGKDIAFSGPLYRSMEVNGDKVRLSFEYDQGMTTSDGAGLKRFEIAGADQKFYWADATIEGSEVVVSSDKVAQPVAVRYAWATNPDGCNLTNNTGLPASPFRTDDWKRE